MWGRDSNSLPTDKERSWVYHKNNDVLHYLDRIKLTALLLLTTLKIDRLLSIYKISTALLLIAKGNSTRQI